MIKVPGQLSGFWGAFHRRLSNRGFAKEYQEIDRRNRSFCPESGRIGWRRSGHLQ